MLGLRSLPVDHRLHRVYRLAAGGVGVLLAAWGLAGLLTSGTVLGLSSSTQYGLLCLVVGLVLVGAAFAGGNVAAQTNAYVGAGLLAFGLICLLFMGGEKTNFMDVTMADVVILFVVGMVLLASGFYGQVGGETHDSGVRANARG